MDKAELNKVLIVEDEEDIRTVIKFALEKRGKLNLEYCSNGQEALDKVEAFMPDLILLDMMMPGMDGVETLKALRKIPTLDHIPIIFMTAKSQSSEVAYYKKIGAIEVITKPFDLLNLEQQLRNIWKAYSEQLVKNKNNVPSNE